ncbi:MAG: RIP metalloprotease RseP [Betaproteobacteria bacterium]|nr:RIP metalloprotease RseP [Betaproteobacteria bacterium]
MNIILHYLLPFLVAIVLLVLVHELGHFLVARWCGVKVLRFSIGFGKPFWTTRRGEDQTEWALAPIPLGGYVKMLDEREGEVAPEELHRAFNRQPVGKRILIVAAGPLINFLFAVVLFWGMFVHGVYEPPATLAAPAEGSAAAIAGVKEGEHVQKIDGIAVESWSDLRWRFLSHAIDADQVTLEVRTPEDEILERHIETQTARATGWQGDPMQSLGLMLQLPKIRPIVGAVLPKSAAEEGGLRIGDEILAIEGVKIDSWETLARTVGHSPGVPLLFDVQRDSATLAIRVTPQVENHEGVEIGRIGVEVLNKRPRIAYGPVDAARRALLETWELSALSLKMLGKMVIGEVSTKNLSGPITIANYAGKSAQMGWEPYLRLLALISVSLGIFNLLPIPILDGGLLLYYFAEIIKRGPISKRGEEIGQQIGMAFLLTLMIFVFYNDINRFFFD